MYPNENLNANQEENCSYPPISTPNALIETSQTLPCKRKHQHLEELDNSLQDSQDYQEFETLNQDLKMENAQLKQSLLLLILGSERREEWPEKWQQMVSKVVNETILKHFSCRQDYVFSEEFTNELVRYFELNREGVDCSNPSKQAVHEWIRTKIKPCTAFNSLLEPISKKIKMATNESEQTIEEDSPIF